LKILFIHNNYASDNTGEEHAAEALAKLLTENGHTVEWYRRSSAELNGSPLKQAVSFFTGIWNPAAIREVNKKIREFRPDIVQVQNVYPLISPRVIKAIKSAGLPVVMRCPNYRLFCPTGLFFDPSGTICEKCTGKGHELWCIRKNCMNSKSKSFAYAVRNFVGRKTDVFRKHVDAFIVQSEFQKRKFIELGIQGNRIFILPGLVPDVETRSTERPEFISFVGRVSREKGIGDFLEAAQRLPELKFEVAGEVPGDFKPACKPENVNWRGFLKGAALDELFARSKMIIVPSRWYEGFPNVVTRAMAHAVPVVTTNIGVFPEIVNNECGLTYPPGDINELVDRIRRIAGDREMAERMGQAGRRKALREYSSEAIYRKLMDIYSFALKPSDV